MTCASRVQPTTENRPVNAIFNQTRGADPNDDYDRITGSFIGTTDEIIQWAACKWGMDPDWARAWVAMESWWFQTALLEWTTDPDACAPGFEVGSEHRPDQCPTAVGLMSVRWPRDESAFEDGNAIWSSSYNIDYAFAVWRSCFEGEWGWLNDMPSGRRYRAGHGLGCTAVWATDRWFTPEAVDYMEQLRDAHYLPRVWEQGYFPPIESPNQGAP